MNDKINVGTTAHNIDCAANTLESSVKELRKIAKKMRETEDIYYVATAFTEITKAFNSIQIDTICGYALRAVDK